MKHEKQQKYDFLYQTVVDWRKTYLESWNYPSDWFSSDCHPSVGRTLIKEYFDLEKRLNHFIINEISDDYNDFDDIEIKNNITFKELFFTVKNWSKIYSIAERNASKLLDKTLTGNEAAHIMSVNQFITKQLTDLADKMI